MLRTVPLFFLALSGVVASGAEPQRVHPAAYRIRVSYDEKTLAKFRSDIADAVEKALSERERRLKRSQRLAKRQLRIELDRYERELEAAKVARSREVLARSSGDLDAAERWRLLRVERLGKSLELARRAALIEQALLSQSLRNWRLARDQEKAIADKALAVLEPVMQQGPVALPAQ
jgi:hypothetical protein